MKRFKQIITILALVFMTININAQKNKLNIENVGEVHNYILSNLIKNNIYLLKNDNISGVFDEITTLLEKKGVSIKDLSIARENVSSMLKNNNLFTTKLKTSDTKKMLDYAYSKNYMSKQLKTKFDVLFSTFSKKDKKGFTQAINDLRNFKPSDNKDKETLNVALSIFDYSLLFWNEYNNENTQIKKVSDFWRHMGTSLADMAGGAAGSAIGGPFGAFYVGANASFAVGNLLYNIE
jgi:hypothetical protein